MLLHKRLKFYEKCENGINENIYEVRGTIIAWEKIQLLEIYSFLRILIIKSRYFYFETILIISINNQVW